MSLGWTLEHSSCVPFPSPLQAPGPASQHPDASIGSPLLPFPNSPGICLPGELPVTWVAGQKCWLKALGSELGH